MSQLSLWLDAWNMSPRMFMELLDCPDSPTKKVSLNNILYVIEINKTLYNINTDKFIFRGDINAFP